MRACGCRVGSVCDECTARYPRVYLPPGRARDEALSALLCDGWTPRRLGGPWSVVDSDGAEVCRYGDPNDACERAREDSRGTGPLRVVDGLRGARKGRGPLPPTARVVATYAGGLRV